MFPHGGPGVALLLLRILVAAAFLMNLANRHGVSSNPVLLVLALVICLISLSLFVGFLTPFLASIVGVAAAANLLIAFNSGNLIHLYTIFVAVSLALLGPGAYSVDAKLFGRRVTVVPPRKDKNPPLNLSSL